MGRGRPRIRKRSLERLNFAHSLLENEEYTQAATVFEELAAFALRRRAPRAPQLFLQAGRAYLMAGNHRHGVDLLIKGLRLIPRLGHSSKIPIIGERILSNLREMELHQEYQTVELELNQLLKHYDLRHDMKEVIHSQITLPSKCPYCGGTVHPDEVEWINENSVECTYCGSVVEGSR
jgi:DNA-directed RNA polymerase subunit RPC12/RpoP